MARKTKLKTVYDLLHEQVMFMARCGGTLEGYVQHYGVPDTFKDVGYRGKTYTVPAWYGNGGEAIFKADNDRLLQLYSEFRMLVGLSRYRDHVRLAQVLRGDK